MKSYNLSQRQKNIVHIIGDSIDDYITVNEIARRIDVSTRTVQRDLALIEDFLYDNDFSLVKKPGQGLILNESSESVSYLYELLEMVDSSKQYEKVERVNFILSRLLTSKEPIKYFVFTLYLNISEKTLTDDLTIIDKWLSVYDIKLIRKRGVGLSIKGSEKSIRKAQAKLINEMLDDDKKIEILMDIYDKVKVDLISQNDILSMMDVGIINRTKKSLDKTFHRLNITISDNSYISLLVHISLSIERLKQNRQIDFNEDIVQNLKSSQDYIFAEKIIEDLEEEFSIEIPDIEIYFVAMHIKGTKIIDEDNVNIYTNKTDETTSITEELIEKMEEIYGLDLKKDLRLNRDLRAHILPALNRLRYKLSIKNPIINEIKDKYGDIYNSLEEIAPDVIRKNGKLSTDIPIPDDEIAYIAIHFITAIESRILNYISVNLLTVCPTGYGASRLLATNLINYFTNIEIVNNASIMNLNRSFLENNGVDLIISTIKINGILEENGIKEFDCIEMPAIPDEDDYLKLTNKLREISRKKYYKAASQSNKKPRNALDIAQHSINSPVVEKLFNMSVILNNIYENTKFFLVEKDEDIYKKSAKLVSNNQDEEIKILETILKRNELNPTYYDELNLHLLHGKSEVSEPKLGFGKLADTDDTIIIMVSRVDEEDKVVNFFSEISSKIVSEDDFLESIRSLDQNKIGQSLKEIIYKNISEIIEKEGVINEY